MLVATTVEDEAKAHHLGADGYLVKPIDPRVLVNRLKALTRHPSLSRVLLIDDSEGDRYIVKQHLRHSSILVIEAANGSEGIRRAHSDQPNIIILDLTMPGMSGFEVLRKLKADPITKDIPVLICTSRVLTSPERTEIAETLRRTMRASGRAAGVT